MILPSGVQDPLLGEFEAEFDEGCFPAAAAVKADGLADVGLIFNAL